MISIIVAIDRNRVIGAKNALPWHLPADLKRFKQLTTGHHVIMGRKTFESIGKPLPGRTNVIVTRQSGYSAPAECVIADSLKSALAVARGDSEIFVIGGGELFAQALPLADRVYLTKVDLEVRDGDTFFPEIEHSSWTQTAREDHAPDEKNRFPYSYLTFEKKT